MVTVSQHQHGYNYFSVFDKSVFFKQHLFPSLHGYHDNVLNFQGSLGSMTSSVDSADDDLIKSSQKIDKAVAMSQHWQF